MTEISDAALDALIEQLLRDPGPMIDRVIAHLGNRLLGGGPRADLVGEVARKWLAPAPAMAAIGQAPTSESTCSETGTRCSRPPSVRAIAGATKSAVEFVLARAGQRG